MRFLLLEGGANFAGNTFHVAEVELAIWQTWSAHAHKGNIGIANGGNRVACGAQLRRSVALRNKFVHLRFHDWAAPRGHHLYFRSVDVHPDNMMAGVRQACGAHRADVAQAEDAHRQARASLSIPDVSP